MGSNARQNGSACRMQEEYEVQCAEEHSPPRGECEEASAVADRSREVIVMLVEPSSEPCCNCTFDNREEDYETKDDWMASADRVVKSHGKVVKSVRS